MWLRKYQTKRDIITKLFCALLFLLIMQCNKKGVEPDNNPYLNSENILGTWYLSNVSGELYVTTNSDLIAHDVYSPGEGLITMDGSYSGSLTYMIVLKDTSIILLTSINRFISVDTFPKYTLIINNNFLLQAELYIEIDGITTVTYSTPNIDSLYTFDSLSYTLTVSNIVMMNQIDGDSIILNGTLKPSNIVIPANIPTKIISNSLQDSSGTEFLFNFDGTYQVYFHMPDDTTTGIWALEGDVFTTIKDTSFRNTTFDTFISTIQLFGDSFVTTEKDIITWDNNPIFMVYLGRMGIDSANTVNIEGREILTFSRQKPVTFMTSIQSHKITYEIAIDPRKGSSSGFSNYWNKDLIKSGRWW